MTIYVTKKQRLDLGHSGENLARRFAFDISAWLSAYGTGGTLVLRCKRYGDTTPYSASELTLSGSYAVWTVTDDDVASPGAGGVELQYLIGNVVVKSDIYPTCVAASLPSPAV